MPKAIRFHQTGGSEVLAWEDVAVGKRGPARPVSGHTAVGVNFVDIYTTGGLYPVALPSGLDTETAGVVEEVTPGVTDIKADRLPRGETVIGTATSRGENQKRAGLRSPDHLTREDLVALVATITKGGKLPVVYDSVGKDRS